MYSDQPSLEDVKKHLLKRGDRIFKGWLILVGILTIVFVGIWLVMILVRGDFEYIELEFNRLFGILPTLVFLLTVGFLHRLSAQSLSTRGEFVRADLHEFTMPQVGMIFQGAFGLIAHLSMIGLARLLPIKMVDFEFIYQGKTIHNFGLLFEGEEVDCDEAGKAWVLVHPQFPRSIRWLVTKED